MMTDRRIALTLAAAFALIAFAVVPAPADEGSTVAKPEDPAANTRTAANLDVAAPRSDKIPAPVVRKHHRRVAAMARRSSPAPTGLVRVAYRPPTEPVCGGICRAPIVLFIGITY